MAVAAAAGDDADVVAARGVMFKAMGVMATNGAGSGIKGGGGGEFCDTRATAAGMGVGIERGAGCGVSTALAGDGARTDATCASTSIVAAVSVEADVDAVVQAWDRIMSDKVTGTFDRGGSRKNTAYCEQRLAELGLFPLGWQPASLQLSL